MLARLDLRGFAGDLRARLPRPGGGDVAPLAAVRQILNDVRIGGDAALRRYTERFDGCAVDDLLVPPAELDAALAGAAPEFQEALRAAHAAISAYHAEHVPVDGRYERNGIVVRDVQRPVDRAGIYVPGGRARYPSTVLMTAVPARAAGVGTIVLCVPPGADGHVDRTTLAAAALAGVDEVYRVGGAQAIAALAYGTESIRPVDVIVGPGNLYVATAKREVASEGVVGVASAFAGPSEVVVVADATTPVALAAIDLVVQAEHGPDGLAWLVTWSDEAASAISEAVAELVAVAPRRADIESTLVRGGYAVLVDGPEQALEVANLIAPEHLELMNADPESLVPLVRHAGAVFVGPFAPASLGDYLAGPSHVLPTFGSARFSSALRAQDFLKTVHVVSADAAALARAAIHVAVLAEAEGLPAHAESVRLRECVR